MKKILLLALVVMSFLACSKKEAPIESSDNKTDKKIKIVTTLFPTYDFSKEIGKDKVEVKLILPPGIEPHSYDPTPKDIAEINSSDIFKSQSPYYVFNISNRSRTTTGIFTAARVFLMTCHSGNSVV